MHPPAGKFHLDSNNDRGHKLKAYPSSGGHRTRETTDVEIRIDEVALSPCRFFTKWSAVSLVGLVKPETGEALGRLFPLLLFLSCSLPNMDL